MPPIGVIDFYGLRTISQEQIRQKLQIKEGDSIPEDFRKFKKDARQRLQSLPKAAEAHLNFVCCDADKTILWVGIREEGSPALTFRAAPRGKVRLPKEIVKAGEAFEAAFLEAMQKHDFAEDESQGYALGHYPPVHAVQENFITLAAKHLSILRNVLNNSGNAKQRALAAQVIAYSADRPGIVPDLVVAIRDPDGEVRNNAMRALGLMAEYGQEHPESQVHIPAEPFVDMLNSIDWTDRNKSLMNLATLTEKRDPVLLTLLRRQALPSLIEMARWKLRGYALPACAIVARIGDLPEAEIEKKCGESDREAVIAAALKAEKTN